MKNCYVLIGVPASGKSTYADAFTRNRNTLVLSSDAIIEAYAKANKKTYNEVFGSIIDRAEKEFWENVKKSVALGKDIMIDRTNLTHKSRKKLVYTINSIDPEYNIHAVEFHIPSEEEWYKRLESRPGKQIPEPVLLTMKRNQIENPVEMSEGFCTYTYI
jgi:predicted kinase